MLYTVGIMEPEGRIRLDSGHVIRIYDKFPANKWVTVVNDREVAKEWQQTLILDNKKAAIYTVFAGQGEIVHDEKGTPLAVKGAVISDCLCPAPMELLRKQRGTFPGLFRAAIGWAENVFPHWKFDFVIEGEDGQLLLSVREYSVEESAAVVILRDSMQQVFPLSTNRKEEEE